MDKINYYGQFNILILYRTTEIKSKSENLWIKLITTYSFNILITSSCGIKLLKKGSILPVHTSYK
jgi:hypothetical protein